MLVDIVLMTLLLAALSVPLAISAWAFLDAAKRPRWVWAFSGHRQVLWMCLVAFGIVTVAGGLAVSGWYLLKVRPRLAAIEAGRIG